MGGVIEEGVTSSQGLPRPSTSCFEGCWFSRLTAVTACDRRMARQRL